MDGALRFWRWHAVRHLPRTLPLALMAAVFWGFAMHCTFRLPLYDSIHQCFFGNRNWESCMDMSDVDIDVVRSLYPEAFDTSIASARFAPVSPLEARQALLPLFWRIVAHMGAWMATFTNVIWFLFGVRSVWHLRSTYFDCSEERSLLGHLVRSRVDCRCSVCSAAEVARVVHSYFSFVLLVHCIGSVLRFMAWAHTLPAERVFAGAESWFVEMLNQEIANTAPHNGLHAHMVSFFTVIQVLVAQLRLKAAAVVFVAYATSYLAVVVSPHWGYGIPLTGAGLFTVGGVTLCTLLALLLSIHFAEQDAREYMRALELSVTFREYVMLKGKLLSQISHELRTPLQTIALAARLLESDGSLVPIQREHLNTLHDGVELVQELMSDVVCLSRLEQENAAGEKPEDSVVSVRRVCVTVCRPMRTVAESNGLQLEARIHSSVPQILRCSSQALQQNLLHLLGLACKISPTGETIRASIWVTSADDGKSFRRSRSQLSARERDPTLLNSDVLRSLPPYRVFDEGGDATLVLAIETQGHIGPVDTSASAFDECFRISDDDFGEANAHGLSLTLAATAANIAGGSLLSEVSDSSVKFWLLLPAVLRARDDELLPNSDAQPWEDLITVRDDDDESSSLSSSPILGEAGTEILAVEKGKYRWMIVDDSNLNATMLQRLLARRFGWDPNGFVRATNGREAVDLFEAHRSTLELIIMDYYMPVLDGREATKLIRQSEQRYGTRSTIVLLTAAPDAVDKYFENMVDAIIAKPITVRKFCSQLKELTTKAENEHLFRKVD